MERSKATKLARNGCLTMLARNGCLIMAVGMAFAMASGLFFTTNTAGFTVMVSVGGGIYWIGVILVIVSSQLEKKGV